MIEGSYPVSGEQRERVLANGSFLVIHCIENQKELIGVSQSCTLPPSAGLLWSELCTPVIQGGLLLAVGRPFLGVTSVQYYLCQNHLRPELVRSMHGNQHYQ